MAKMGPNGRWPTGYNGRMAVFGLFTLLYSSTSNMRKYPLSMSPGQFPTGHNYYKFNRTVQVTKFSISSYKSHGIIQSSTPSIINLSYSYCEFYECNNLDNFMEIRADLHQGGEPSADQPLKCPRETKRFLH